ncbi:MAG: hypothetical protein ACOYJX_06030 [Acutalibacteraceae bacterium]
MKKTVTIFVVLFILGILAMFMGMSQYYYEYSLSISEDKLWKEILSLVFTLLFIAYLVYSLAKKDKDAIRGFWLYFLICLISNIPINPWDIITDLGLFQPAFCLLLRLSENPVIDTIIEFGPLMVAVFGFLSTSHSLLMMSVKKAGNAEKYTENNACKREKMTKKTVAIVFVFIFLGLLAMSLGMVYLYIDSIWEKALWKEILSLVFTLSFISYLIYSLVKKDEAAIKAFWIYCLICFWGFTPFLPLFAFIGLGLFQPAFWLLYRLPIDSESRLLEEFTFGSPFVIVVLGLALTSVSLAVMSVRKKAIKSKADSAEKHTENSTDTGE